MMNAAAAMALTGHRHRQRVRLLVAGTTSSARHQTADLEGGRANTMGGTADADDIRFPSAFRSPGRHRFATAPRPHGPRGARVRSLNPERYSAPARAGESRSTGVGRIYLSKYFSM
jgi:hypothetical protein